jgi:hypothetical protein
MGQHVLEDGEAKANATVCTGDERHQVAIHARKRMHGFWYIFPPLRPKTRLQFMRLRVSQQKGQDRAAHLNSLASSPHISVERFNRRIGTATESPFDTLSSESANFGLFFFFVRHAPDRALHDTATVLERL